MLDRYPHDLNYLKARHTERLRDVGVRRLESQADLYGVRERVFSVLGDLLIGWGRKLKGDLEIKELSEDCA